MSTVTMLKPAVLLVVGSVRDRQFDDARWHFLDSGRIATVVRMSRREYLGDFYEVLKRHGIGKLQELGRIPRGSRASWINAIVAHDGNVGGIVMDSATWPHTRDGRAMLTGTPMWVIINGVCGRVPDNYR